MATTQLENGGAYHQYQPLTRRGNDAIGSGFNDDPLWLVLGVAAYLKETGDLAVLDEPAPYDNAATGGEPLLDHLRRAVRYTLDRLGRHGLPLIGRADWNDCLNLNCFSDAPGESFHTTENRSGGAAESVMAGVGLEDGRAPPLASVRARLLTDHGIVLQQPAYSRYRIELGEIPSYPRGTRRTQGSSATRTHGSPSPKQSPAMATRPSTATVGPTRRRGRRSVRSTAASRTCTRR